MSHKQFCRLTPEEYARPVESSEGGPAYKGGNSIGQRLRKKAISGWKLIRYQIYC